MTASSRTLYAAFFVAALAALAGCAGTLSQGSGPAAEAPAYRVGDRWVYTAEDGFRVKTRWEETHEVTAIGADGITVRITQKGETLNVTRTEQWAAPVLVKVGAVYNNETRRFTTPLQVYNFPLASGKVWNQHAHNFNEFTGKTGVINRYVRVRGWDKVTTPAGTFDAVSMHVIMHLDDDEFWRHGTECNYLVWYAPAVRGMVREERNAQYLEKGGGGDGAGAGTIRTQFGTLQLVSFTPGGS
jgi:hypothetical protein